MLRCNAHERRGSRQLMFYRLRAVVETAACTANLEPGSSPLLHRVFAIRLRARSAKISTNDACGRIFTLSRRPAFLCGTH